MLDVVKGEVGRTAPAVDVDLIGLDAHIADLGIESIALLEVVSALEQRYAVHLPDRELSSLITVGDLVAAIRRLAPNGAP